MKRILSYIFAIGAVLAGVFFALSARRHDRAADRQLARAVQHKEKQKVGALEKANQAYASANDHTERASAIRSNAETQIQKLREEGHESAASLVDAWNNPGG